MCTHFALRVFIRIHEHYIYFNLFIVPRGAEVGLDSSMGYTQEALTNRRQSSTLKSHRLIAYIAKVSCLI